MTESKLLALIKSRVKMFRIIKAEALTSCTRQRDTG